MARQEFIKKAIKKAPSFVNKEGLSLWLEYAYQEGYKEAVEEAIKWLSNNKDHPFIGCEDHQLAGYLTNDFIKDFKQAMEE